MTPSCNPLSPRRARAKFGPRWRRSIVVGMTALVAGGLIGSASASASWYDIDDQGNATPAGQGSAPDSAASNGDPEILGQLEGTETDSTVALPPDRCDWTVKGRLIVRNPTVDGLHDGDPVEGVEVKVSGKASGIFTTYNEWNTVTTDSDGKFSVSKTQCDKRIVRVEARFESDELRTTGAGSRDWYKLRETDLIAPSTIDLHGEPFGGESGEQLTSQARTDAQTWIVFQKAIDYADSIGHPFLNKVVVHNPATLTSGVSAADPILRDIHIDPVDTADLDAWLHELGHVWAYTHTSGEGCLTFNALLSGDTHDAQESPCVAISEGVAGFFGNKIEQEMNAANLIASTEPANSLTPRNRAGLAQTLGLESITMVAASDLGWESVFRVLTSSDITRQRFGTATGTAGFVSTNNGPACVGQPVGQDDLADALTVIGDAQDQLDIDPPGGLTVGDLLDRAAIRLPTFDADDALIYEMVNDPAVTLEPAVFYNLAGVNGHC